VISPSDPCSAWTAKANKRVQFGYGLNYLIGARLKSRLRNSRSTRRTLAPHRHPALQFQMAWFTKNNTWLELSQRDLLTISEQVRGQRFAAF
jgi:hypothetical protein